jgi:hypothetical protein
MAIMMYPAIIATSIISVPSIVAKYTKSPTLNPGLPQSMVYDEVSLRFKFAGITWIISLNRSYLAMEIYF